MIFLRTFSCVCCFAVPALAVAQDTMVPDVPSGRTTVALENFAQLEQEPAAWRFRFVQKDLISSFDYEDVASDLLFLCDTFALAELGENVAKVSQVIIGVADQKAEFGIPDPEIVQTFEVFDVVDGHCQWGAL